MDDIAAEPEAPLSPEKQAAIDRLNKWQSLPLGHLEKAAEEEKAAGRWTPETGAVFSELAQNKLDEWMAQTKELPAKETWEQSRIELDAGRMSPAFFDSVVKESVAAKAKADQEKSLWQHTKDIAAGVLEHPLEVATAPVKSVMEAGRLMGESAAGSQAAGSQIGAALESNLIGGVNVLQGLASYVVPEKAQRMLAEDPALKEATGGVFQQRTLERDQLKAGDTDSWWKTYNENRLPEHRARYGEGLLNKAVGLSASELEKDGIHVSPTEYAASNIAGMGADVTNFVPVHLGASVAANGAKLVLQTTEAGGKVVGALERLAGPVKSGTLAPTLETQADAVTRVAQEAERYNTTIKRARVAAGNTLASAGQALKTAGIKSSSDALTAAGLAALSGADSKEVAMAGLAGALVRSKASRVAVGGTLEVAGKVLRSDLPLPLENFRRGVIDFNRDYNVVRAATAGATQGVGSSALFALGAEDDQARADLLAGGAILGAAGAFGQRAEMAISDTLVKRQFGGKGDKDVGPVQPSKPIGANPTADAVHSAAEARLSQDGLRVSNQARAVAEAFDGQFYAASDGQGLQALHDSLSKTKRDVSGAQGFSIPAEDSVTGKPIAASQIGSVNGQSSGHEIGHLVMSSLGAFPEGKAVSDRILTTAANSLGATWDAKSGQLQFSSPMLDAIRDHYQQLSPTGDLVSHEYALNEYIAEHFSAMAAGLPAGKLGGSSTLANAVGKAFFKFGDILTSRKAGLAMKGGTTTSEVLPYSPDIDLFKATQNVVDAFMYERSKDVPSASMEHTQPPPAKGQIPVPQKAAGTFKAGEGILNPVPAELAVDQSLRTSTPPQQARPEAAAPAPEAPSEVTPQGAIRGQEVQAARTNIEAPLTPEQEKQLHIAQPDPAKREVARQVLEHINAVAGQGVGLPIAEVAYRDSTTGKVASKRVAPIGLTNEGRPNKDGTYGVQVVDLDRTDYNASILFDWAAEKGQPDRFGYTGINDPQFIEDRNTYLRNQAESRRGGGEPLYAKGVVQPTGEPVGRLSREKEMFMSMIMGMEPKLEATPRSLAAIARIRATAEASGITGRVTAEKGYEPNSLRDQLRSEGAPLAKIGADPDPTREQSNTRDRNIVNPIMKLEGFESFKLTGQSTNKPNIKAIEASFMPKQKVTSEMRAKYLADPDSRGGHVVNADIARRLLPNYDPFSPSTEQHKAAARLADAIFEEGLRNPEINSVVFTAGGAGSGKSTALRNIGFHNAPDSLLYDSVFGTYSSAAKEIQATLDAGKAPTVIFVYRGFEDSVRGNLSRAARENRVTPLDYQADRYIKAMETFGKLQEKFGGRAEFFIIDNSGAPADARIVEDPQFLQQKLASTPPTNELIAIGQRVAQESSAPAEFKSAFLKRSISGEEAGRAGAGLAEDVGGQVSKTQAYEQSAPLKEGLDKVRALPVNEGDGATFNLDGTTYEGKGVVFTLASKNVEQASISPKDLADFADQHAAKSTPDTKIGIYKIPDSTTVSIDLNMVLPKEHLEVARKVAAVLGQESMFDLHTYTNEKTGASGKNPLSLTDAQVKSISDNLMKGVVDFKSLEEAWKSNPEAAAKIEQELGYHPLETTEMQSIKSAQAAEGAKPKAEGSSEIQYMPTLAKAKVKGKDVQFKREKPLKGAVGGLLEGVHFSSKSLSEIDPKKSFGKGAATSTDLQGEPKVFFYKKGTAYEAPISSRSNVYEAKIDGNSIYDYNEDVLGVRSIVNREKRDLALKKAGFNGFYVETAGFDAIAIFDKVGVNESSHENVMSREQLQDAGRLEITPEEAASREDSWATSLKEKQDYELRFAKAKEAVKASKGYELAKAKIAKEVGNDYSFEYSDRLNTWAEEQAAKKAVARVSRNKDAVVTVKGEEILKNPEVGRDGDIIGGARFMPTNEVLKRFALTDEQKKSLEGRHGFAIVSDWSDAGRPYVTQSGRKIDVVQGGIAYPFQAENFGKAGWAGTFSNLSERVVKKINKTSGLGIVVMGGEKSSASSRCFAIAVLAEFEDSIAAKKLTKRQANAIVEKAVKPFDPSVKTLEDLQALIELPNTDPRGLTFENRQNIIMKIGSHENKKQYGILNWLDVMKKYNVQKGAFESGQIVSVIQFKQGAGLKTAEQVGAKPHKSYEAVFEGAGIGMLKEPVFIKDFFADFFEKEGTLPKAYTRKVQTKMPEFVYGKGSAKFPLSELSETKVSRLSSK